MFNRKAKKEIEHAWRKTFIVCTVLLCQSYSISCRNSLLLHREDQGPTIKNQAGTKQQDALWQMFALAYNCCSGMKGVSESHYCLDRLSVNLFLLNRRGGWIVWITVIGPRHWSSFFPLYFYPIFKPLRHKHTDTPMLKNVFQWRFSEDKCHCELSKCNSTYTMFKPATYFLTEKSATGAGMLQSFDTKACEYFSKRLQALRRCDHTSKLYAPRGAPN